MQNITVCLHDEILVIFQVLELVKPKELYHQHSSASCTVHNPCYTARRGLVCSLSSNHDAHYLHIQLLVEEESVCASEDESLHKSSSPDTIYVIYGSKLARISTH